MWIATGLVLERANLCLEAASVTPLYASGESASLLPRSSTSPLLQSRCSSKLRWSCDGVTLFVTSFVVLPRVSTARSLTFSGEAFTAGARRPNYQSPPAYQRRDGLAVASFFVTRGPCTAWG
ncbi:hypothetical protein E2542_SST04569 [Spatholobus suberectus]|nr:hypothetical protein E2542_SST04569 [Spatholobus suberectus]